MSRDATETGAWTKNPIYHAEVCSLGPTTLQLLLGSSVNDTRHARNPRIRLPERAQTQRDLPRRPAGRSQHARPSLGAASNGLQLRPANDDDEPPGPYRPDHQAQGAAQRAGYTEEIWRLTKACEEHERKIRSSKSTIEHRVFLEFPNMISRLNEIDDQADELSASLQATLRNSLPDLQKRLDEIVHARRADVETMRERTTPWRHLEFDEADDGHAMEEEDPGRIPRVEGVGSSDELARIEGWANEVENYLTSEIVRLRENIQHTSIRRKAWRYFIYAVCTAVALLISIILVGFTAR
ncbi:hypothetical protein EHS25_002648 [Saitozyma podzolica]|uniref:Uncharacterized protein n=1 Tax=Saitozyma podzolica TaxID=1890683 RepID=A0A427YD33_9TREE|nr:hypothetical protein EHS25_002648 [Saitozyma podzolica]